MSPLDRLRSGLGLTHGDLTVALFLCATALAGYAYTRFFEDPVEFRRRVGMARLLATADSISRQNSLLGLASLSDSLTPEWNPLSREEVLDEGTDGKGRVELSLEDVAPIDINSAPPEILQLLPGVGEKTAIRIIQARPFSSVDDITRVHGIGPKKLEKMRPYIVASGSGRVASSDTVSSVADTSDRSKPDIRPASPIDSHREGRDTAGSARENGRGEPTDGRSDSTKQRKE